MMETGNHHRDHIGTLNYCQKVVTGGTPDKNLQLLIQKYYTRLQLQKRPQLQQQFPQSNYQILHPAQPIQQCPESNYQVFHTAQPIQQCPESNYQMMLPAQPIQPCPQCNYQILRPAQPIQQLPQSNHQVLHPAQPIQQCPESNHQVLHPAQPLQHPIYLNSFMIYPHIQYQFYQNLPNCLPPSQQDSHFEHPSTIQFHHSQNFMDYCCKKLLRSRNKLVKPTQAFPGQLMTPEQPLECQRNQRSQSQQHSLQDVLPPKKRRYDVTLIENQYPIHKEHEKRGPSTEKHPNVEPQKCDSRIPTLEAPPICLQNEMTRMEVELQSENMPSANQCETIPKPKADVESPKILELQTDGSEVKLAKKSRLSPKVLHQPEDSSETSCENEDLLQLEEEEEPSSDIDDNFFAEIIKKASIHPQTDIGSEEFPLLLKWRFESLS